MKSRKWVLISGLVIVLVAVMVAVPAVWAQGPGNGNGPGFGHMGRGFSGPGYMGNGMGRWGGTNNPMLTTVAETLGIEQTTLLAELQAGKTVANLAEKNGVGLDTLIVNLITEREAWLNTRITSGQITQAQADFMLNNMRTQLAKHFSEAWSPGSYGPGYGMGFGQGMGNGAGYLDTDGDGTCDHYNAGMPFRNHRGGRWGQ